MRNKYASYTQKFDLWFLGFVDGSFLLLDTWESVPVRVLSEISPDLTMCRYVCNCQSSFWHAPSSLLHLVLAAVSQSEYSNEQHGAMTAAVKTAWCKQQLVIKNQELWPKYVAPEFEFFKVPKWVKFGRDHLFKFVQDQSVNMNNLGCWPHFSYLKALINLWLKLRFWWNYFHKVVWK